MAVRRLDEYLRSAARAARRGGGGEEPSLDRIVEMIADAVARRVEERIVSRITTLLESLKSGVGSDGGVAAAVEALMSEVRELRSEIEEVKRLIAQQPRMQTQQERAQVGGRPANGRRGEEEKGRSEPRWIAEVRRRLEEEGYALASRIGVAREVASGARHLARAGIVAIPLGGDYLLVERSTLRRLVESLSGVKTSDVGEAAMRLGELGDLFMALRELGLIIYNGRSWTPVGALRRILESAA